jgi:hypothetical protein
LVTGRPDPKGKGGKKKVRKVNKRRRQNNDMGQGVIPPRNAISPAR